MVSCRAAGSVGVGQGLAADEAQGAWQLHPLAILGHLDGAARTLAQGVDGVVVAGEGGREVLAAEVVDELQFGLAVALDGAVGDDPAEGVVALAEESGQLAVELLAGDGDVLVVEVDAQVYLILIIIKVRAKGVALLLGAERSE